MGHKIQIKKIEDDIKRQVTFSKRRSSLIKRVQEISDICGVDVMFLTFSSSGRVSKYCNRERIEDLIQRYVNLPVEKRLSHIKNPQEKIEKLLQLDNVNGEEAKLQYVARQFENLELNIKKYTLQVQIAEANLRDFEVETEKDPSLYRLIWSERNLRESLTKVRDRKKDEMVMANDGRLPFFNDLDGNGLLFSGESSSIHQPMDHNPKIGSHSAKDEETLLQELMEKVKKLSYAPKAPEQTLYNNTSNGPISIGQVMDQFGLIETLNGQLYNPLENNSSNAPNQSAYPMNQPAFEFSPSQQHAIPQAYPQDNGDDYIMPSYQLWQHAPLPSRQHNSNSLESSTGDNLNLVEDYLVDIQPSFVESNVLEETIQNTISSQDANNVEGIKEGGDNIINNNKSPALVDVATPLQVSSGSYNAFPSEVALGADLAWSQTNQGSGMWGWDDLGFLPNDNFPNFDN